MDTVTIQFATEADLDRLVALRHKIGGDADEAHWQISERLRNSPHGNILAQDSQGECCGLVSFCQLDYDRYEADGCCTWSQLSGNGTAATHDPKGPDLFGIALDVDGWAPADTAAQLMAAAAREGMRRRVRRGLLGVSMPGYAAWSGRMSAQQYWRTRLAPGGWLDPELSFFDSLGLHPRKLVENYAHDPRSLNWGVIVEIPTSPLVRAFGPLLARLPLDLASKSDRQRRRWSRQAVASH